MTHTSRKNPVTRRALLVGGMALCLTAAGAFMPPASALATVSLADYAQPGLRDLHASMKILSHNGKELAKIGKGYAQAYQLGNQEIWCKEPGKVRFQGKKGLFTIRYVTSGSRKLTEVPTLRIRKAEDISKEPAKGDSISDLGVITTEWVKQVEDQWLRSEMRDGRKLQVFQFWYRQDPRYKHTIWVDPATKTIVEHISHHRAKKRPGFKKKLVYSEVKQFNGISLPTRVTIFNGENKQAADMRYEKIQVNTGLDDKMFQF